MSASMQTTIHRLIHWFHPNFFAEISNDEHLAKLQAHFENTQMLVFDEVSMIGRKMMGRIDSRTQQAVADRNCNDESLGGMSLAVSYTHLTLPTNLSV